MNNNLKVILANPSGNKTIFVINYFNKAFFPVIGGKILHESYFDAEQVGFVVEPIIGGDGRLEMAGNEFCGNASRAYGLMLAKNSGLAGIHNLKIEVSGIDHLLEVQVNTNTNHTKIEMPFPKSREKIKYNGLELDLVIFDGIIHAVVFDKNPDINNFHSIREEILSHFDSPAIGVMYYNTENKFITPIVWVKEIQSTYFEGSCGSGSVAVAVVLSSLLKNGMASFTFPQPEGTLEITLEKDSFSIKKIYLSGYVEISDIMEIII